MHPCAPKGAQNHEFPHSPGNSQHQASRRQSFSWIDLFRVIIWQSKSVVTFQSSLVIYFLIAHLSNSLVFDMQLWFVANKSYHLKSYVINFHHSICFMHSALTYTGSKCRIILYLLSSSYFWR